MHITGGILFYRKDFAVLVLGNVADTYKCRRGCGALVHFGCYSTDMNQYWAKAKLHVHVHVYVSCGYIRMYSVGLLF